MSYVMLWYRKGPAGYVGSLMDYVARGYSPALGRFVSADTIVPGAGNPAALNRYMYVFGNPLSLRDPSGHDPRGSQNNCNYAGQGCGGAGSQVDITTRHIILAGTQWYYAEATADPTAGLDGIQTVLDVAGLVPGIGEVADGANALISVARGDLAGAGLSAVSMIPVAGDLIGKGGKAGRFAAKHADEAIGVFTRSRDTLRARMTKSVPKPADMVKAEAHHELPWELKKWFNEKGLDPNDPQFGRWVKGSPYGPHQKWSSKFSDAWSEYMESSPDASADDIVRFLEQLRSGGTFPSR